MSYDFTIFDPSAAPGRDYQSFSDWFDDVTAPLESASRDEPSICTPVLRAWHLNMVGEFPAMNGPYASDDPDDPKVTDYALGEKVIVAGFAWSQAAAARRRVVSLAQKHGVGFHDPKGPKDFVWSPASGRLWQTFYCFYGSNTSVPSDSPVFATNGIVLDQLLRQLRSDKDFLGVVDDEGNTLQTMYHKPENRFWVEIPVVDKGGSVGAYVDQEGAERVFRGLPDTFTPDAFPSFEFRPW